MEIPYLLTQKNSGKIKAIDLEKFPKTDGNVLASKQLQSL